MTVDTVKEFVDFVIENVKANPRETDGIAGYLLEGIDEIAEAALAGPVDPQVWTELRRFSLELDGRV